MLKEAAKPHLSSIARGAADPPQTKLDSGGVS
jgi:hypothetical protein